jgi:Xaa-Pro dipeptidase
MAAARIDAMLLPAGASLRYFTGADWHMLERFTGALLPQAGEPAFVAPAFEEPRLTRTLPRDARLLTWQEDQSPFAVCADQLRGWGRCTGTIAIDEACPYFVVRGLAQAAPQAAWTDAAAVAGACRQCKSPAEIALIRHAMQATLEVQRLAREILVEGMAAADVVDFLDKAHRAAGADGGSTFAIVAFGAETAHPHGPEQPQQLREGDLVLVDTGCQFHGYHADLTRTYVFGAPTPRQREIWELQRAAQQAGFEAIRVGAPCGVVDDAARNVLVRAGLGPDYRTPGLPHRTGHGIGLEIHERPYLVRGNAAPLLQGMCASIEPTVCIYGEFGVRQEDHFYLTDEGPRWFTQPPDAL